MAQKNLILSLAAALAIFLSDFVTRNLPRAKTPAVAWIEPN